MAMLFSNKKLWLLAVMLIVLRLPHLNRPLSKHHEFNTAVILINAESWQQAGGGVRYGFTPLMNYQGSSNKILEAGAHVDEKGNHVYLSFGAGWYVLPYLVFHFLNLPPTPLALQVLNILIGLITTRLFFRLLMLTGANRKLAFYGTMVFVLLPAPLWYMGIGYVTTAVMLPLVLGLLFIWHRLEKCDGKNIPDNIWLWLTGVSLCYFDWLAVFLLAGMAAWAAFKARKQSRYIWVSVTAMLSLGSGIFVVLFQFAKYIGWEQVMAYWQSRFLDRSTDTSQFSFGKMVLMVAENVITGYLPLLVIVAAGIFLLKKHDFKRSIQPQWPLWALASVIVYNAVFLNWSAQHEFALMAFGLIVTILVGTYLLPLLSIKKAHLLVVLVMVGSLVQYYLLNLPGPISIKGDRYDSKQQLGDWIAVNIDPGMPVFTNVSNDKITEYYAKRTMNVAENASKAKQYAIAHRLNNAVWLQITNDKVERMVIFFPPGSR